MLDKARISVMKGNLYYSLLFYIVLRVSRRKRYLVTRYYGTNLKDFLYWYWRIWRGRRGLVSKGGKPLTNRKQTSRTIARIASRILRSSTASKASKRVAGSALSQTKKGR
jgi:hypothetical protein